MSNPIVIASLSAIFSWWLFTGVILLVVRLGDRFDTSVRTSLCWASFPIALLGVWGMMSTAHLASLGAVYGAFLSALLIWGWIEFAFLTGVITGPNRTECPKDINELERFIRAWGTLAYHEIALLVALLLVIFVTWGATNTFGAWTFIILYGARVFAKLNLYFGVPRVNVEFIPKALTHLISHFKIAALNWFFPLSVTLLTFALGCWVERIFASSSVEEITGFTLLAAMTSMALLEHWVMVLPVPDARLWRWMLPQKETVTTPIRRKDSHGL